MLSRALSLVGRAVYTAAQGGAVQQATAAGSVSLANALNARLFSTNSTDVFNIHKDTPDNNASIEFDYTEPNYKAVNEIIARYPPNYKQSAVIPLLDVAQQQNKGFITLAVMNRIAKILEMPPIRVYEVATFYTMFNRTKIGKYHVMICGTTPCRLQGAQKIEEAVTKHLGIQIGQTTSDGWFTLGEMECMGACVNAPMVAIADYTKGVDGFTYEYYEDLTPEDSVKILEQLKAGQTPRAGSQHRSKAEPAGAVYGGKWHPQKGVETLSKISGPYCRDLSKC